MANFGPLTAELDSGVEASRKFQRLLRLDFVKAKFHYAIQVADLVSDLLQTGSSYLDMSK